MSKKKNRPHPQVQAAVLCDHVYRDGRTGKFVIAGTFTHIRGATWPALHQTWFMYLSLTNFDWKVKFILQIVDLKKFSVLARSEVFELESHDRLATVEQGIQLPPFPIPHEGAYAVEVLQQPDNLILASTRFLGSTVKPEQGNE